MSKIGEYIHLRRDNYLKLPGQDTREPLFSQYGQAKNKALNNFLNGVGGNDEAAKNLENALNKLFPTDSESLNAIDKSEKFKYDILQDASDSLDRAPGVIKQILNDSIKSGVLTATGNGENEQTIAESSGRRRAGLIEIRGILRSMLKRIDEESPERERWGWHRNVINILNGIENIERAQAPQGADKDTKKQVVKINNCLNKAQNKIAALLESKVDLSNYTPKHSITISQDARVRTRSLTISRKNGNHSEVYHITRGQLKKAIKAITNALQVEAIVAKDIGDGAEYMLGAIARACNLGKDGKTQKAMRDYVFGDARTSTYFDLDLFSGNLEFLKDAKSISSTGKGKKLYTAIKEAVGGKPVGYKSTSTSQDKIDVIYEGEDVKAILQKAKSQGAEIEVKDDEERMTLSVKNYTQGGTFGGVSGTSFLSLVQSIDPDFVNHWINLTIGHQKKDDPSSFVFVSEVKEKEVNDAHLIMQRYLIKLGAAGGALKFSKDNGAKFIDQAQYIVWNDRSGKTKNGVTWHVYPMQRILFGIGRMTDLNNYIKVNTENYKDYFQDQKIDKGWVTKVPETDETNIDRIIQQRIDNVLKFMWEQKITTETPVTKALAASNA